MLGEDHARGTPWVLNDPFAGGTHLPDITVITPVLADGALLGFAASRAHHADVGGAHPRVDARGQPHAGGGGRRDRPDPPGRGRPESGCPRGCASRASAKPTCAPSSPPTAWARCACASSRARSARTGCARRFAAVLDYAERRARACLLALARRRARGARTCSRLPRATCVLRLRATVAGERLMLDFTGSAPQHAGNLNCPLAVTRSACLFAARVLTDPDIPPIGGRLPADRDRRARRARSSTPAARRAPAGGGRGQRRDASRVADLVLAAFGRAQGQGTMNNLTLGDRRVLLLRDARRRPGRVPGRGRPERRARRDEQHPQHARSRRSSANSRCA